MLFEDWSSVARVVVSAAVAYAALVVLLRTAGKRTLAKLNAFDLVVTVALGSTLSSVVTSRDLPLVNGIVALAVLVMLQVLVSWAANRWRRVNALVKSEPRVLFHRGAFVAAAMDDERVTKDEIMAAVRRASVPALDGVEVVILESSGDLSVVRKRDRLAGDSRRPSLRGVRFEDARVSPDPCAAPPHPGAE